MDSSPAQFEADGHPSGVTFELNYLCGKDQALPADSCIAAQLAAEPLWTAAVIQRRFEGKKQAAGSAGSTAFHTPCHLEAAYPFVEIHH